MAAFEVQRDDEQSYVGALGSLVLTVTRRPPTVDSLNVFAELLRSAVERHGARTKVLLVLAARRPRMGPDERAAILDLWRNLPTPPNVCIWVRGQSFAGALQRSFITALLMIGVRDTPHKVVSTDAAAIDWLLERDPDAAADVESWRAEIERVVADPS